MQIFSFEDFLVFHTSCNHFCPLCLSNQRRSLVRVPGAVRAVPGTAARGRARAAPHTHDPLPPPNTLVPACPARPAQGAGCRATLGPSSAAGLGHEVMASGGRERERSDSRASGRRGGRRRRSLPPAPSCCPAGGGRRRSPRGVRAAPPPEEAARPQEPCSRQWRRRAPGSRPTCAAARPEGFAALPGRRWRAGSWSGGGPAGETREEEGT